MEKTTTAEINVNDLKQGQKVEMFHSRKKTIRGIVKSNSDSEWISITLLDGVSGMVNTWVEGEELTCRKSFLSFIKLID